MSAPPPTALPLPAGHTRVHTLTNGFTVLIETDHSAPVASASCCHGTKFA